jgi:C-terminal processing protease CtpA/Prc
MARDESISKPTNLSLDQRRQIFDRTVAKVTKYYFDPNFNGTEWPKRAGESKEAILSAGDPDEFELRMHDLVRSLKTSHTGFFHQSARRVPARLAISASFRRAETAAGLRWVAQDVHEGGPAHSAGLKPLDVLKSVNGTFVCPPEQPMFPMGSQVELALRRGDDHIVLRVTIPRPRDRKQPYSEPKAVAWARMKDSVGYLKVTILPGQVVRLPPLLPRRTTLVQRWSRVVPHPLCPRIFRTRIARA